MEGLTEGLTEGLSLETPVMQMLVDHAEQTPNGEFVLSIDDTFAVIQGVNSLMPKGCEVPIFFDDFTESFKTIETTVFAQIKSDLGITSPLGQLTNEEHIRLHTAQMREPINLALELTGGRANSLQELEAKFPDHKYASWQINLARESLKVRVNPILDRIIGRIYVDIMCGSEITTAVEKILEDLKSISDQLGLNLKSPFVVVEVEKIDGM